MREAKAPFSARESYWRQIAVAQKWKKQFSVVYKQEARSVVHRQRQQKENSQISRKNCTALLIKQFFISKVNVCSLLAVHFFYLQPFIFENDFAFIFSEILCKNCIN